MSSLSAEAISSVVGSIYRAAYDQTEWQATIDNVHKLLDCSRACIAHTGVPHWKAIATVEDQEFHSPESYAAHMRDPFAAASIAQTIGVIFSRQEVIDEAEFRRRELWNEWMLPRDMWRGLTCNLHGEDGGVWSLHLHRGKGQAEFDEEETRALRICADHMMRAKVIADEIHHVAHFGKLFEQLPIGIALADSSGKVVFLNREAEALMTRSASIATRSGRILCTDQTANTKLATLIASAASIDPHRTRGGTLIIQEELEAGPASIVVSVAPFSGPDFYSLPSRPFALVILRDVFLQPSAHLDSHIRDLFGLTPAESSLCVVLAGGNTLQDAAARNGITVKTARTYLERIFSKTATRQQSQLIALIKGARPLM